MMSKARIEKQEYWRQYVERFKTYPGSIKSYCEVEGINHHTFQYWREKLSNQDKNKRLSEIAPFVSVCIDSDKSQAKLPDAKWLGEFACELIRGLGR
jgi:hypothetical protein